MNEAKPNPKPAFQTGQYVPIPHDNTPSNFVTETYTLTRRPFPPRENFGRSRLAIPRNLAPALVRLTLKIGRGAIVASDVTVRVHMRVLDVLEVGFVACQEFSIGSGNDCTRP